GLKVAIVQFMKGGEYTGEFKAAKNFFPASQFSFVQFGKGCVKESLQLKLNGSEKNVCKKGDFIRDVKACGDCRWCFTYEQELEKEQVREGIKHAKQILGSGEWDLVILDEINCAASQGIVPVSAVVELVKKKPKNIELVLTGRNAPEELLEIADLITEMREIKHPWKKGISARKGIEY
ncbi:unnamed protein product, partial [marine sediment metagenome]